MTPKERAAMQQALEALVGIQHGTDWNNGTHAKIYRPKFPAAITAMREALAEPVKLAISEEAFNWIDANAPMFVRKALAEPQITTPDVCGEVCARAKLCYGCNKDLEEANAKYVEQAEQKPVAWKDLTYGNLHHQDFGNSIPLYAAPVRTKDLTDDEIYPLYPEGPMCDKDMIDFARAVIAADRELNK